MKKIVSMTAEKIFEAQKKRQEVAQSEHLKTFLEQRGKNWQDWVGAAGKPGDADTVEKLIKQMDIPSLKEQISKVKKENEDAKLSKFLEIRGIDKPTDQQKAEERKKLDGILKKEKDQFDVSNEKGKAFKEFLQKKLNESIAAKAKGNMGLEFLHMTSSPDQAIQFVAEAEIDLELADKIKALKQLNADITELKDELSKKPRTSNKKERKINIQRLQRVIIALATSFQEPEIQTGFKKLNLKKLKPDKLIKTVEQVFNAKYSLDNLEKVSEQKAGLVATQKQKIQTILDLNDALYRLNLAMANPEHDAKKYPNKKTELKSIREEIQNLVLTFPDDAFQKQITKEKLFKQNNQKLSQRLKELFKEEWVYCALFTQNDKQELTNIDTLITVFAGIKKIDIGSPDDLAKFKAKIEESRPEYNKIANELKTLKEKTAKISKTFQENPEFSKLKKEFQKTPDFKMEPQDKEYLEQYKGIEDSKSLADLKKRKKAYADMAQKVQQVLHLSKELQKIKDQQKSIEKQEKRTIDRVEADPDHPEAPEDHSACEARKKDLAKKNTEMQDQLLVLCKEGVIDFMTIRKKKADVDQKLGVEKPKIKLRTDLKHLEDDEKGIAATLAKVTEEEKDLKARLDQLKEKHERQGARPAGDPKDPKVHTWDQTQHSMAIAKQELEKIQSHKKDLEDQKEKLATEKAKLFLEQSQKAEEESTQKEESGMADALEKTTKKEKELTESLQQLKIKQKQHQEVFQVYESPNKDLEIATWNTEEEEIAKSIKKTTQDLKEIQDRKKEVASQKEKLATEKASQEPVTDVKKEKKAKKEAVMEEYQKLDTEIKKRKTELGQLPRGATAQARRGILDLEIAFLEDRQKQIRLEYSKIKKQIEKDKEDNEEAKNDKKPNTLLLKIEQTQLQDKLDQCLKLKAVEPESGGAEQDKKPVMDFTFFTDVKVKDGTSANPFYFTAPKEDQSVLAEVFKELPTDLKDVKELPEQIQRIKQMAVGTVLMKHSKIEEPDKIQLLRRKLFFDDSTHDLNAKMKKFNEDIQWPESFNSAKDFDVVLQELKKIDPNINFYLIEFLKLKFAVTDDMLKAASSSVDSLWKRVKLTIDKTAEDDPDRITALGQAFKTHFEKRLRERTKYQKMAASPDQTDIQETEKILNIVYLAQQIAQETESQKLDRQIQAASSDEEKTKLKQQIQEAHKRDSQKLDQLIRSTSLPDEEKRKLKERITKFNQAVEDSMDYLKDDTFNRLGRLAQAIFV